MSFYIGWSVGVSLTQHHNGPSPNIKSICYSLFGFTLEQNQWQELALTLLAVPLVRSNMLLKYPKLHIVFLTYIWSQDFTSGGSRTQMKTPTAASPLPLSKDLKNSVSVYKGNEPLSFWNQQCLEGCLIALTPVSLLLLKFVLSNQTAPPPGPNVSSLRVLQGKVRSFNMPKTNSIAPFIW